LEKQLTMQPHKIPLEILDTQIQENTDHYVKSILEGEIEGIHVEHVAIANNKVMVDSAKDGYKTIYLFIKGSGDVVAENTSYKINAETIFLPNVVKTITIKPADDDSLHYLKISCRLSTQDKKDLDELPTENSSTVYCAKFIDCQSYSEAIKSPNTTSRTILSNEYIPRVAMGTVQTKGPDKVAAHEHPMLEQLFLGLSKNNCVVYANDDHVAFTQYSILHIPLGSSHWVSVEEDETLYYVWMDFFLDKKGEEWLQTHKVDADQR